MDAASAEAAAHVAAPAAAAAAAPAPAPAPAPKKGRRGKKGGDEDEASKKRRCISSACVPCRKRKSKCDGTTPACSACAAVYNTECIYDPNSDHRRKGVYKKDIDSLKTRNSTLQTLIQAILNYPEDDATALVRQIRTCESLDAVAEAILARENGALGGDGDGDDDDEPVSPLSSPAGTPPKPTFESQLSGKMGELRLEDGSTRYIGGTSHLIYLGHHDHAHHHQHVAAPAPAAPAEDPFCSWTTVTADPELVQHLISMYFTWHYSFFTTLSKNLFLRDFQAGRPPPGSPRATQYCTPLLVNAMLALGCHFTSLPAARAVRDDSATAGDHFFREAKRLIMEEDLHEVPALPTVQALALMSVREAGCGREAKGWVYSGMSFRMACDLGLNLGMHSTDAIDDTEDDARRITFWGCFLFDKCWSNYLGRMPQLANNIITVPKFDVFPDEDAETWSAYTDSGVSQAHSQPSRTRAVALQISKLCEISSDLMQFFYNPIDMDKAKGKHAELKKLSEIHMRLETWRRELPKELEPKEGGLPHMLVMHMFFQLLYIHLFRPFLKYNPDNSPLPPNVSPRKQCTQAAAMISKLLRLYKRSHGLRQICNICVYIAHSACTIHLLNLPEKNAKRDIIHGIKHLEEIAEGWLCARRTLGILSVLAKRWKVDLPEEAAAVLARTDDKFGPWNEISTPKAVRAEPVIMADQQATSPTQKFSPSLQPYSMNIADVATPNQPARTPASSAAAYVSRPSSSYAPSFARDLPPTDLTHTRLQRHPSDAMSHATPHHAHTPATPASTQARQSLDGLSSAGASPSQLFGGVDQLIREGQDWIFRDQTQLASGFDNWSNQDLSDMASWFAGANPHPVSSFPQSTSASTATSMNGGPVGGLQHVHPGVPMTGPSSSASGGVNGHAGAGMTVAPSMNMNSNINMNMNMGVNMPGTQPFTYDERSWYDYQ